MSSRLGVVLGLALLVLGVSGCTSVGVSVSSLSNPELARPCRYCVRPADPETSPEDLEFLEYAGSLSRALARLGYQRVPCDEAEQMILLDYGVGPPTTTFKSFTQPVYGQTGGGLSTINATSYGPYGTTSTSGSLYTPPSREVVGSTTTVIPKTRHPMSMRVAAFSLTETGDDGSPKMAWMTTAESLRRNDDLSVVFPYMLAAACRYFGSATKERVSLSVSGSDSDVAFLKGEPSQ